MTRVELVSPELMAIADGTSSRGTRAGTKAIVAGCVNDWPAPPSITKAISVGSVRRSAWSSRPITNGGPTIARFPSMISRRRS